jgi:dipeptidyl aminopeptidase/acylaminoacyl peptidase
MPQRIRVVVVVAGLGIFVKAWLGAPEKSASQERQAPSGAPALRIEQADTFRLPADLQFSGNGNRLAFQVDVPRKGASRTLEIWVVDVATRKARRFAHSSKSDRMPRWSPDDKNLAFISDRNERAQVYVIPSDGGEAEALTEGTYAVSSFAWSPDGKHIAFLAPEPKPDAKENRQKDKDDARVIGVDENRTRLWTIEVATKKVRKLTDGHWEVFEACWSPAGKQLFVFATEHPNSTVFKNHLLAVSTDGSIVKKMHAPAGPVSNLQVSPDGATLSFLAARKDGPVVHDVFLLPVVGGTPRNLTGLGLDRPITWYAWQRDGRLLAVVQDGFRSRGLFVTMDGKVEPLPELEPHFTYQLARTDSRLLAFVRQGATVLPEVWLLPHDGKAECVTHFNDLFPAAVLIEPEYYHYKSFDGVMIEAALYRPRVIPRGARAPLVALIHGGPSSRWDARYRVWIQLLATHGFAVFCPNIRGSSGYGWDFLVKNRADWCGGDFKDVMSGVDDLVRRGIADPERLGIAGGSYGGQMAAWAPTQTTRFKAAVISAGVADMASEFGTENVTAYDYWYYGVPYENLELFTRSSPITYVKNNRTPTLILHGENDRNNPLSQSQQLHRALKHYGVECEFVVYPREPHQFNEEKHLLDSYRRLLRWFDTHLTR